MLKPLHSVYLWGSRQYKLWEALGLALLLLSWIINWRSTERWATARAQASAIYDKTYTAFFTTQTVTNVRLEAARGRALRAYQPAEGAGYLDSVKASWESGEVRQLTAVRVAIFWLSAKQLADEMAPLVRDYVPEFSSQLGNLNSLLESSANVFTRLTNADPATVAGLSMVPEARTMPHEEMAKTEAALMFAVEKTLTLVSNAESQIDHAREKSSTYASLLFGIGSLLLFIAKALEWRRETTAAHSPLAEPRAAGAQRGRLAKR